MHGGIPRVFVNLARGFIARGHTVDLVQISPGGDFRSQVPPEIHLVDLNARRAMTSIPALARYMRTDRPDVVIAGAIQANIAAVLANRLVHPRIPLILTEHNIVSVITADAPMLRTRLTPFFLRAAYPHADQIVAVSRGSAADLAKILPSAKDRISVIYNPVIGEQFLERARQPLADEAFAADKRPAVLAVGRLHYHKDYPTLLRAFARVRKAVDARLVFFGSGEELARLTQLTEELGLQSAVTFKGDVANPLPYMREARVLALSSMVEALPTVLIEAMGMKLPIVATDCPTGPREILAGGAYGTLVPVGNEKELATALTGKLSSGQRSDVSEQALERFQHDSVIDEYLALIEKVRSQRKN